MLVIPGLNRSPESYLGRVSYALRDCHPGLDPGSRGSSGRYVGRSACRESEIPDQVRDDMRSCFLVIPGLTRSPAGHHVEMPDTVPVECGWRPEVVD